MSLVKLNVNQIQRNLQTQVQGGRAAYDLMTAGRAASTLKDSIKKEGGVGAQPMDIVQALYIAY